MPWSARVDRFVVLPTDLDADAGELTRDGAPDLRAVAENFRDVLASLDGELGEHRVTVRRPTTEPTVCHVVVCELPSSPGERHGG
jgi:hypothetical protein